MRIIALCCRIMITRDELEYYFYTDQVTRHIFKLHMCLFHETELGRRATTTAPSSARPARRR